MSEVWQPARFIPFADERMTKRTQRFLREAGMTEEDLWVRSERPRPWGCRQIDAIGRPLSVFGDNLAWLSNIRNGRTGLRIVIAAEILELQPECRTEPPAYFTLGQQEDQ